MEKKSQRWLAELRQLFETMGQSLTPDDFPKLVVLLVSGMSIQGIVVLASEYGLDGLLAPVDGDCDHCPLATDCSKPEKKRSGICNELPADVNLN